MHKGGAGLHHEYQARIRRQITEPNEIRRGGRRDGGRQFRLKRAVTAIAVAGSVDDKPGNETDQSHCKRHQYRALNRPACAVLAS